MILREQWLFSLIFINYACSYKYTVLLRKSRNLQFGRLKVHIQRSLTSGLSRRFREELMFLANLQYLHIPPIFFSLPSLLSPPPSLHCHHMGYTTLHFHQFIILAARPIINHPPAFLFQTGPTRRRQPELLPHPRPHPPPFTLAPRARPRPEETRRTRVHRRRLQRIRGGTSSSDLKVSEIRANPSLFLKYLFDRHVNICADEYSCVEKRKG